MITLTTIRNDLKDIRYYYARKQMFDEAMECTGKTEIVEKAQKYNDLIKKAPPRLYDLYVSLYLQNNTQETLADKLSYTPEYIQILNKKLLKFLQSQMTA